MKYSDLKLPNKGDYIIAHDIDFDDDECMRLYLVVDTPKIGNNVSIVDIEVPVWGLSIERSYDDCFNDENYANLPITLSLDKTNRIPITDYIDISLSEETQKFNKTKKLPQCYKQIFDLFNELIEKSRDPKTSKIVPSKLEKNVKQYNFISEIEKRS